MVSRIARFIGYFAHLLTEATMRHQGFKIAVLILLLVTVAASPLKAQFANKLSVGIGIGIDYGGIGSRVTYESGRKLGIFASAGYNFDAVGFNIGGQFLFLEKKSVDLFLCAMYGYNTVLGLTGSGGFESTATYYGPSVGGGAKLKVGASKTSYVCFEVILPFRPGAVDDAIHDLRLLGYKVDDPLPVGFSIGYHFRLKRL